MPQRIHLLILTILVSLIALSPQAQASAGEDRFQVGRNIIVQENESAGDLVCIGCSIRIDGTAQDVVAIGGTVLVNGTVKGDLAAVGGGVTLGESATVDGDLATVGGRLIRHPDSIVKGDVSSRTGAPIFLGLMLVPLIPILLIVALVVWLVKPNRKPTPVRAWQPPPPA
jgi:hypothetical protein